MAQLLLVVCLSIMGLSCVAQSDTLSLTNDQINEILTQEDTLSGERNYHVLLKSEDNQVFQVYIWINDRLGETMFEEAGMYICRLYTFNQSQVFIYAYQECKSDVSPEFLRKRSELPYSHLTYSPFFVSNGFHQAFLVKKTGSSLEISRLVIADENDNSQDLIDLMDF